MASEKPTISWIPLRILNDIVEGRSSVIDWLRTVPAFGLTAVEIYHGFVGEGQAPEVRRALDSEGLLVAQFTCAPDFTQSDPLQRKAEVGALKQKIDVAATLGAGAVRATAGMARAEVSVEDGCRWAADCLVECANYGESVGVLVCLENHYKDRRWPEEDFSYQLPVFLRLYELIEPTPVMVNFDCANPTMCGYDGLSLLKRVSAKARRVHISDRLPGEYQQLPLGEGAAPLTAMLDELAAIGYNGFMTIEDGQPYGDEGFRRSIARLREWIDERWA